MTIYRTIRGTNRGAASSLRIYMESESSDPITPSAVEFRSEVLGVGCEVWTDRAGLEQIRDALNVALVSTDA